MRWLYFVVSSSVLIILVLLIRKVFCRKLSPGVIYALWLVPAVRLMTPFGFWELPVFGSAAGALGMPWQVLEEAVEWATEDHTERYEAEPSEMSNGQMFQNVPSIVEGTMGDDSQTENRKVSKPVEDTDDALGESVQDVNDYNLMILGIWLIGSIITGGYAIHSNWKLKKSILHMEEIWVDGQLPVCVSDAVVSPCLFGLFHPCIFVSQTVKADETLYMYVLEHEQAHFAQKDHIWTSLRIVLCVIYWWHPLVWAGAAGAAEDAELACDARVIRGKSLEERRAYGYSLLRLLELSQKSRENLCVAASMSGGKKSMRRRMEGIVQGTGTKRSVLLLVCVLLAAVMAVGCGIPSSKSWMRNTWWYAEGAMDDVSMESEYEFFLQDEIKSRLLYYEMYHYGELTDRHILTYGNLGEDRNENLKMTFTMRDEEDLSDSHLLLEQGGLRTEIPVKLSGRVVQRFAGTGLVSEEKLEIQPGDDYTVSALYLPAGDEPITTYQCMDITGLTEEKIRELFQEQYITVLFHMVFSDLPEEQLREVYEAKSYPASARIEESAGSKAFVQRWAKAFVNKDADAILEMASDEAETGLEENGLLIKGENYASFGMSSPWPWLEEEDYRIVAYSGDSAEILYYAQTSVPEISVWRETLELEVKDGIYQVVSEQIEYLDRIISGNEFYRAYPNGEITGTRMDYQKNGLGEYLNQNALENPDFPEYRMLFEPELAACYLLNVGYDLSDEISLSAEDTGGMANVQITFLQDGQTVEVTMVQPYGEDGIWIVQTAGYTY